MKATRKENKIFNAIKDWKEDIYSIRENEQMLIISGEGYYTIWEALFDDFVKVAKEKNAKFSLIVGPVISVNEEGKSPLFDLVKNDIFTLYKAPSRERSHFRTINNRVVYSENYHMSVSDIETRSGKRIYSPFIVSWFNYIFHNKIAAHNMKEFKNKLKETDFIKLPVEEIKRIREPLGKFYDSLFEDEIKILLGDDKRKDELILKLKMQYPTIH